MDRLSQYVGYLVGTRTQSSRGVSLPCTPTCPGGSLKKAIALLWSGYGRYHLTQSADPACDHMHDGMGFLTQVSTTPPGHHSPLTD